MLKQINFIYQKNLEKLIQGSKCASMLDICV